MTLEQLRIEEQKAYRAYYEAEGALESTVRERVKDAKNAIIASLSAEYEKVGALSNAARDAKIATENELIRLAQDGSRCKFEIGQRLRRIKNSASSWRAETIEFGILEVVTRDTVFPDNIAGYTKPNVGNLIVRICTKDGKPGKRFVDYRSHHVWVAVSKDGATV